MSSEVLTLKIRNGRTVREIEVWPVGVDSVVHDTLLERVVKKCFASGGTKVSSHELVTSTYPESSSLHTPLYFFNICLKIMLSSLVRLGLPSYLFRVGFMFKMLVHLVWI